VDKSGTARLEKVNSRDAGLTEWVADVLEKLKPN
jgi:hypothetical protein